MAAEAVLEPQMEALTEQPPEFVEKMLADWRAKIAHVFVVYGNVNDYSDNSRGRISLLDTLSRMFDSNVRKAMGEEIPSSKKKTSNIEQVFATYNLSAGLEFRSVESKEAWVKAMTAHYGADEIKNNWPMDWADPASPDRMFWVINRWITASKAVSQENHRARQNNQAPTRHELFLTLVITDADTLFPDGSIAQLNMDRSSIVHIRNWARDVAIGDRNRIILVTRHLGEIHESIRGGSSNVSTVSIPKPTIADREEWLNNFARSVVDKVTRMGKPISIGSNDVTQVNLADGFDLHQFAVQAAGMSRRQMEDVIMKSWLINQKVDFQLVRERKQRALEDEYQGIVDFFEPEQGFETIGGHDHLKKYFQRKIIYPLRIGDKRLCTSGMLMSGPPGCQPAGSKVLMANGTWKNVEDVRTGDQVISPQQDGSSIVATVTETVVYDRRPVYEVATRGRSRKSYRCADNHILTHMALIRQRDHEMALVGGQAVNLPTRRRHSELRETQVAEFMERGASYRHKARVFTTPAVNFPEQSYAIPPYVMGAMLGDGSVSSQPNFTSGNDAMFARLTELGVTFGSEKSRNAGSVCLHIIGPSAELFRRSAIAGCDSYTKFVPEEYKRGSLTQRLQLLAGLIDTDGSIDSYTTCSERLARDFVDVVHSVGGFASYRPRTTYDQNGTACFSFRVHFSFAENMPGLVEVHKSRSTRDMDWKNPRMRGFTVTYVGMAAVHGFVLDSPSEWYVTDDWLVTHNTGKTAIAKALAKEAKMNFMIGHLDKLFDGLVGGTEAKTRKFFEAVESAAPVIVFLDEMDSILSSGRSSGGDSGTSARVFNAIMQFLSDESRKGRVVVIGASNRPDLLDSALIRSGRFDAKLPVLPPKQGDAKGRLEILKALLRKHGAVFHKESIDATLKDPKQGVGRLLYDKERIWTGAEIEVVLKEAFDNAAFADRKKSSGEKDFQIHVEDWNQALDDILPNTDQVERMTKLALLYVDHLGYTPKDWVELARDKRALREELGIHLNDED